MVVKRQKSDANLGNGKEMAVTNRGAGGGALIQAVSFHRPSITQASYSQYVLNELWKEGRLMER